MKSDGFVLGLAYDDRTSEEGQLTGRMKKNNSLVLGIGPRMWHAPQLLSRIRHGVDWSCGDVKSSVAGQQQSNVQDRVMATGCCTHSPLATWCWLNSRITFDSPIEERTHDVIRSAAEQGLPPVTHAARHVPPKPGPAGPPERDHSDP
ncbi:hypothetical protein QAD02_002450 [Eretmocerus hayati]|uniref:Uncharacterized protein n=1 Tax=Eretmocerus hayati TaxID=131215 RepID=A0ACC2NJU7_9HYME|nr:hypothetical protein QAD02_002450 [Eretmocerus hayati]